VLIQRQAVREEKTWHVPYKYKALETRKRERRGETEKRQGRDRKKKRAENRGTKKPKKKRTHNKKNTKAGKRRTFSRENHLCHLHLCLRLRHCQVRPSFSFCFCISCCKIRKQGKGNYLRPVQRTHGLNHACLLPSRVTSLGQ